jgi:hypothetical protein
MKRNSAYKPRKISLRRSSLRKKRQQRGGEGDIFEYIDKVKNVQTFDYTDFRRRFEKQFGRKKAFGEEDITPIIHTYRTNQNLFFGFLEHIPELALYKTSQGHNMVTYICDTAIPDTQDSLVRVIDILGVKYAGLKEKEDNAKGRTPLQIACFRALERVALKILSYGAEESAVSHVSKEGYTALMYSCMLIRTEQIISKIIEFPPEVSMVGYKHEVTGMTAMIILCSIGNEYSALKLLERYSARECNVAASSVNKEITALTICCAKRLYKVLYRMLDFPAIDINLSYVDKRNNTVLHCICLHGYKKELEFEEEMYELEIEITDLEKLKNTMDSFVEIVDEIRKQMDIILSKQREYNRTRNQNERTVMREELETMKNKLDQDEAKRSEYEDIINSGLATYEIEGRSFVSKKENLDTVLNELKQIYEDSHKKMEKTRKRHIPILEDIAVKIISHGADECNLYHLADSRDPKSTAYHYAISRGMNKVVYSIDRLRYETMMYHMKPRVIEISEKDTIFDPIMMEDTPITEYLKEEENKDKVVFQYKNKMYIVGVSQIRDSITDAKRYRCKTAGNYNPENINTTIALYDIKKISDIVIDGSVMYSEMIHIDPKKTRYYVLEETSVTYPTFISASLADATKTMSLVSMTHCNAGAGGKIFRLVPAILPKRASATQRSPPRSASKRITPPRRDE